MRQDHDRHARANECLRKSRDLLEQLRESQVQTAKFVAEARAELNGGHAIQQRFGVTPTDE